MFYLKNTFKNLGEIQTDSNYQGYYKLVIRGEDNKIRRETPWFKNLITDAGLNRLGTSGIINRAAIGTGTTPPSVTDTSLAALSAVTNTGGASSATGNSGAPDYYSFRTVSYRFPFGTLNGNYTEVAVGWDASGFNAWSRSLILDGNGNPTSISVASNEALDVIYQLRNYPPLTDSTYELTIDGVTYTVVRRAGAVTSYINWSISFTSAARAIARADSSGSQISAYTGALAASTASQPSGSVVSNLSGGDPVASYSYSNNSYEHSAEATIPTDKLNVSGGLIKTLVIRHGARGGAGETMGTWWHEFTPALPKDNTIQYTLTAKVSWGRL